MKATVRIDKAPSASATLDGGLRVGARLNPSISAGVSSWNGETGDVTYTPPVTSVNGQTGDVVLSADVASVNGKTGEVVLNASDVGALPDSYAAPVSSVNSKTGAVTLSAADVGAIPDTTTFALGYDPDSTVGLAKVGDAVTDEPFYTPTGTIAQTMEEVSFMTGGTAELTASFASGTLTLGVSLTPTTATKNVATSAPVFNGNGVHFVIEEDNL